MVGSISPQTATFLCTKYFFKSHNSNQTNVKIVFRPGLRKKCLLCATCTLFPRFSRYTTRSRASEICSPYWEFGRFTHGTWYVLGQSEIARELGDFWRTISCFVFEKEWKGKRELSIELSKCSRYGVSLAFECWLSSLGFWAITFMYTQRKLPQGSLK